MQLKNKKKFFIGLVFSLLLSSILLLGIFYIFSGRAFAVTVDQGIGATLSLGTTDLKTTILNIIRWALGLLGLVAVVIILYGGFIWMTAAGNEEKVRKAKRIIIQATIGLVIILLAFAIVSFIFNALNKATGGGGGGCSPRNTPRACSLCNNDGVLEPHPEYLTCQFPGSDSLRVLWNYPRDNSALIPMCSMILAVFNGNLLDASLTANHDYARVIVDVPNFIEHSNGETPNTCTVDNDCSGGFGKCFTGICKGECLSGTVDAANNCQGDYVAGTWTDNITDPGAGHSVLKFVPAADYLASTRYQVNLSASGPGTGIREYGSSPRPFSGKSWWFTTGTTTLDDPPTVTQILPRDNATGMCLRTPIQAKFSNPMDVTSFNPSTTKLTDPDGNNVTLARFDYDAGPDLLSTRAVDVMDAGKRYSVELISGDPTSTEPTNGIMDVCQNHLDGNYNGTAESDNFMSVSGPNPAGYCDPTPPGNNCTTPWDFETDTDTTNISCVPEITGVSSDGRYDSGNTTTISGSNFGLGGVLTFFNGVNAGGMDACFDGNNFPGVCALNWTQDAISLTNVPGGPINFNNRPPSSGAADGPVNVQVAGDASNNWPLNVTSPQISRISAKQNAPHGGDGQFVSIWRRGDNDAVFGSPGTVYFRNKQTGVQVAAALPPTCPDAWTDNYIVVKVPDNLGTAIGLTACTPGVGGYEACPPSSRAAIQVQTNLNRWSNLIEFVYTDEPAGPGLCRIAPTCGTQGVTDFTLSGEGLEPAGGAIPFELGLNPPVNATNVVWSSATSVQARVPTGIANSNLPYLVNVITGGAHPEASNSLPMSVPCGGIPEVVLTSCNLTLGLPQSTSPYINATNACRNAMITALFNMTMDVGSITDPTHFELFKCNSGNTDCTTDVPRTILAPATVTFPDTSLHHEVRIQPQNQLDADTWYQVRIKKEVSGPGPNFVMMNQDFAWQFKTKTGEAACPITNVTVAPNNLGSDHPNSIPYTGGVSYFCQALAVPATGWSWTSTQTGIATINDAAPGDNAVVADTAGGEGATLIKATVENKTGQGLLSVILGYCQRNDECQARCQTLTGFVNHSVCDSDTHKCTPVVGKLSPGPAVPPPDGEGPKDALVTVQGCFFENSQGPNGAVTFGGTPADVACGVNGWSDTQIIVKNPRNDIGNVSAVSVHTNSKLDPYGFPPHPAVPPFVPDTKNFRVIGQCTSGGAQIPTNGMPGICPPITPNPAHEGESVTVHGYNLFGDTQPNGDAIAQFTATTGWVNAIVGSGGGSLFKGDVPENVNVISGNFRVTIKDAVGNYCPSNELYLGIRCNVNADCNTTCCRNVAPYGRICRPTAECSTGGVGQQCQIADIPPPVPVNEANPYCASGPVTPPGAPGQYDCISNTGDRQSTTPPPPGDATTFGSDCKFCCVYPSSYNGLTCVEGQAPCDGVGRGLYCGCNSDLQCPGGQGCSPLGRRCCFDKPRVDSTMVNDCRNGAVVVNFNTVMDGTTLNNNNVKLYFNNDGSPGCPIGTPYQQISLAKPTENKLSSSNSVLDWLKNIFSPTAYAAVSYRIADPPMIGAHNWCPIDIYINGRVEAGHTIMQINPRTALPADEDILVVVQGSLSTNGGVFSRQHLAMSDGLNFDFDPNTPPHNSYAQTYHTGTDICQLARVTITGQPALGSRSNDLFTCAGLDDCYNDQRNSTNLPDVPGNQHLYTVSAYDASNRVLVPDAISWADSDQSVLTTDTSNTDAEAEVTSQVKNGRSNISATVTSYGATKTATVQARVSLCQNPWPNPYPPDNQDFPYEDSYDFPKSGGDPNNYTNFSTSYCKDKANLPTINSIIVKDGIDTDRNPNPPTESLVKEFFFLFQGNQTNKDDAIGIRVMENDLNLSPLAWYRKQFGSSAPEPQTLTVGGYPALRSGRTVYVSAWNLICWRGLSTVRQSCADWVAGDRTQLYNNIYLISYNEGAKEETLNIYNQLLANWEFNVDMGRFDLNALRRDMTRQSNLTDIYAKMLAYKEVNKHFPLLDGGTFIQGMTNSKWPSWQTVLAAVLGGDLPVDPVNDFTPITEGPPPSRCAKANGFNDPNTCWDEADKVFEVPEGSHTYQYIVGASGDFANLYTRMEYEGPGSLINYTYPPAADPEPCSGNNPGGSSSICSGSFNYQFLIAGNLQDHLGPEFSWSDVWVQGAPIWNRVLAFTTRNGTIGVQVNNLNDPSGVSRVEYYIEGIRKYISTDGSNSWLWNFDTTQYPDRVGAERYTMTVVAYDTLGNRTSISFIFHINNHSTGDTTNPFINITLPANDARVSGTINMSLIASDNLELNAVTWGIFPEVGPEIAGGSLNAVGQQTFIANPSADTMAMVPIPPNGRYRIHATAIDAAGNVSDPPADVWVNLDNTDTSPPTITLSSITSSGTCAKGTCAVGAAECSPANPCANGSGCNYGTCTPGTDCAVGNMCRRTGPVTINVSASDTQTKITRFVYSVDGVDRFTDDVADAPSATSSWIWNSALFDNTPPDVVPPPHSVSVIAFDEYGHGGSLTINTGTFNTSADQVPPTISFIAPTPDDYYELNPRAPITLAVDARDNLNAVQQVNFYFDYVFRESVAVSPYTTTFQQSFIDNLSSGCHTFSAQAVDAAGNTRTTEVRHIGVGERCYGGAAGPSLANVFVTPPSGQLNCVYTISADVTDPDGVGAVQAVINDGSNTWTAGLTRTNGNTYQTRWRPLGIGTFQVNIVATDVYGAITEQDNIPSMAGSCGTPTPPVITSPATASGIINRPFSYQITASPGPISSYAVSGTLPPGVTLNNDSSSPDFGKLSGTPTVSGTYNVTLTATNPVEGTGPGRGLSIEIGSGATIFVTSVPAFTANFGGLSGGDAICQSKANTSPLVRSGTWRAWLSSSTQSASSRLTHNTVAYRLPDSNSTLVASNWTDLTDGNIASAININEQGVRRIDTYVWTGTTSSGGYTSIGSCANWTSNAGSGVVGYTRFVNSSWSYYYDINSQHMNACTNAEAVYCLWQQP